MIRPGGTTIRAMDETEASGADVPRRKVSQREAVKKIRAADTTFWLNLPGSRQVRLPTPAEISYYFGLAVLVAVKYIGWPVVASSIGINGPTAVFLAAGYALSSRAERKSKYTAAATAAAVDQLRTEIRRLDEMLRRNGEGDQAPIQGT
jgi:hypothetical protein